MVLKLLALGWIGKQFVKIKNEKKKKAAIYIDYVQAHVWAVESTVYDSMSADGRDEFTN